MVVKVTWHFDSTCALIALVKGFDIVWFNIVPGLIGIAIVFKMNMHNLLLEIYSKSTSIPFKSVMLGAMWTTVSDTHTVSQLS
jgi:hypothetical protein